MLAFEVSKANALGDAAPLATRARAAGKPADSASTKHVAMERVTRRRGRLWRDATQRVELTSVTPRRRQFSLSTCQQGAPLAFPRMQCEAVLGDSGCCELPRSSHRRWRLARFRRVSLVMPFDHASWRTWNTRRIMAMAQPACPACFSLTTSFPGGSEGRASQTSRRD